MERYESLLAEEEESNREPVEGWSQMAKRLQAGIRIGVALNNGEVGYKEDWLILAAGRDSLEESRPWNYKGGQKDKLRALGILRTEFEGFMRAMILQFGVSPRFSWDRSRKDSSGEWRIDFDAAYGIGAWEGMSNLGGILVFQAMMLIADRTFAICSNCHRPYSTARRPSEGRRNYCELPECRRAAWKDSKRGLRRREREVREARQGV